MNQKNTKIVLITGSSKRLGEATALKLHSLGMDIIIHYNSSEKGAKKLVSNMNDVRKNSAISIKLNLRDFTSYEKEFSKLDEKWSSIDVLINNASTFYPTPIDEISEEHWDKLIGSNLKGPLFLIQGLKDKLIESRGSIVNITDTNLSKGVANFSIYASAKGGLESVTKVLARELAPEVNVNAIAPGAMLEPPDVTWTDEQKEKVIANIPLKKMGSEKDIANTVKFVVSSKYMTGQVIKVDGGRSLS